MAGEILSWDERIRRIGQAGADLSEIEHLYRLAKSTHIRERGDGYDMSTLDILLKKYLDSIVDLEAAFDLAHGAILDHAQFGSVPHVWKPGEIDDFDHFVFVAATGSVDAHIEAQDAQDAATSIEWDGVLSAGDIITIKNAANLGNNLTCQLDSTIVPTPLRLTIRGVVNNNISGTNFPGGVNPVIVSTDTSPPAFNFTANVRDKKAEVHWVYEA